MKFSCQKLQYLPRGEHKKAGDEVGETSNLDTSKVDIDAWQNRAKVVKSMIDYLK